MLTQQSPPFVVTLEIDDEAQARFDRERAALFAPGRTQVGAHVTLFHAVPAAQEPAVLAALSAAAREPFPVEVFELMPLGRGVAYRLRSAELLARQDFTPFEVTARAQRLWRYESGPWTGLARFALGTGSRPGARSLR